MNCDQSGIKLSQILISLSNTVITKTQKFNTANTKDWDWTWPWASSVHTQCSQPVFLRSLFGQEIGLQWDSSSATYRLQKSVWLRR